MKLGRKRRKVYLKLIIDICNSPVIVKYLLMKIFGPYDGQLICMPKANVDETLPIFVNLLPELSVINFHSDLYGHLLFFRVVPSASIFHN